MTTLVIAAHGTRSATGMATTHELATAIAAARPDTPVELCFLDIASPTLPQVLDRLDGPAVVVPLLLSAGYHVTADIPEAVGDRDGVTVAAHLGPDPLVVAAVAARLRAALESLPLAPDEGTVAVAAIASTRSSARGEVECAVAGIGALVGRPVTVLPLDGRMRETVAGLPAPLVIGSYLLAEGGFLDALRDAVGERGVVADPLRVDPTLVALVWSRFDAALAAETPAQVR